MMTDLPPMPPGIVQPVYSPKYAEHVQSLATIRTTPVTIQTPLPAALPQGFSITNLTLLNGTVTLRWQQGTPPFSVQASSLDGNWTTVGTTTNRSLSFLELPQHYFRIVQGADLEIIPYHTSSAVKAWVFRKGDATATSYDLPGWGGYPEANSPTSQPVNGNTLILAGCPQGYGPPTIVEHLFTGTNFIKTGTGPKSGSNNVETVSCSLSNEVVIASWGMIARSNQTTHLDFLYRTAAGAWSAPLSLSSGLGNDPLAQSICFGPDGLIYYFVNADSSHIINLFRLRRVNGQLQLVDDVIPLWSGASWPPLDGEAGPSGEVAWMDARLDAANNRVVVEYQQTYYISVACLAPFDNASKVVVMELRPDKTWTVMDISPDYASHYLTSQRVYPFADRCYLVEKCINQAACTQTWELGTMVNGGWSGWAPIQQTGWSNVPPTNDDGYWVTPDGVVHKLNFSP